MIKLLTVGNAANTPSKEYLVSTVAELSELVGEFGDLCFCIENKNFYIADESGQFVVI